MMFSFRKWLQQTAANGGFRRTGSRIRAGRPETLESRQLLTFAPAVNIASGTPRFDAAIADLNLDGNADLVTANHSANTVSVMLGNGSGGFGTPVNFTAGTIPTGVAVNDFNKDGRPDLAVANFSSSNVSILLGNGAGSFSAPTNVSATGNPLSLIATDLNGDGNSDLVVQSLGTTNLSVLLGNGSGGFATATNVAAGQSNYSVTAGDFNGDGRPDLAVPNLSTNTVSVLLGTGSGSFSSATTFSTGAGPRDVAVGDFNRDGRMDLVTVNRDGGNASIFIGNGSGGFAPRVDYYVGEGPVSVSVGDFNRDGSLDISTANSLSHNVGVLFGNGSGAFSGLAGFAVGTGPNALISGDFNQDSRLDLAVANFSSNNVSVLLNNTPLSSLVVTSLADNTNAGDGVTTLREAVALAEAIPGPDTIQFDPSLFTGGPATITLATVGNTVVGSSNLGITSDVTILGPLRGAGLTISNSGDQRLFYVSQSASLTVRNVTLNGGRAIGSAGANATGSGGGGGGGGAGLGGAVYVDGGRFTANSVNFTNNTAVGGAGGSGGSAGTGGTGGAGGGTIGGGANTAGGFGGGGGGGNGITALPGGGRASGGFGGGAGVPAGVGSVTAGNGGFGGGGGGGQGGMMHIPFPPPARFIPQPGGGGGGGGGMGGAIFSNGGTVDISSSSFTGNTTTGGSGAGGAVAGSAFGGAIFAVNGSLTATSSVFSTNTAQAGSDVYVLTNLNDAGVKAGNAGATVNLSSTTLGSDQGDNSFATNAVSGGLAVTLMGDISTAGTQSHGAPTILAANRILTASNGGGVSINNTFNGAFSLTINSIGVTTIGGAIGGTTALTTLTTDAGGSVVVNANVTTSGTQTYNDGSFSATNATLTHSGANSLRFGATTAISISGTVTDNAATINSTSSISSNISGNGSLVKIGLGTLLLSGSNTYTGNTIVAGGTLLIDGSTAANSNVTVNAGVLGGTGTVGGSVTVNATATLTGGTLGGVGALNVGSLIFNGGTFAADFNADTSDSIVSSGTINLNGGVAGVFVVNSQAGTTANSTNFTLLSRASGGAISNPPLSGAGEGAMISINGIQKRATYAGSAFALVDPNLAPTAVVLTPVSASIAENVSTTSAIELSTISITDDGLGTNTLSLGGVDSAHFEIVGNKLRLKAGVTLNFEAKPSYSVRVNVDDATLGSTPDAFADFTLTISDVNEAPLAVLLSQYSADLLENADTSAAIELATVTVMDDALGTNSLSLSGPDAVHFEIVGNKLRFRAGVPLNVRTKSSYLVQVNVDDPAVGSSPDESAEFTLRIKRAVKIFAEGVYSAAGSDAENIAVADFNRDGFLDAVTSNWGSDDVSVLLGDGAGGLSTHANFPVGSQPRSVAAGDFNGDGKPDIVTGNYFADSVSLLLGDGLGNFAAAAVFSVGNEPYHLTTADLNGDGALDVITSNNSGTVSVLLGNNSGGFSASSEFETDESSTHVTVADFNLDGHLDVASANWFTDNVSVLLGDGTGSLLSAVNFPVGQSPYSVTAGDFNGDGKPDLATANDFSNDVSILLGNGAGGFSAPTNFSTGGSGTQSVTTADFNLDGKLDIATVLSSDRELSLLFGDGFGGFEAPSVYSLGPGPNALEVGDFNGDGKPDVAVVLTFSSEVAVLLNNAVSPNAAPTAVSLTPTTAVIQENTNTTSAIELSTIAVTDDGRGTNELSLSGPDAASFEISGNKLRLRAGVTLNFESKSSYSVRVNVDDATVGSTPDAVADFTLTISDVNEAPSAIVLSPVSTSLAENSNTTSAIELSTISITDDALGTNTLSLSGPDAASFEIVGNKLRLKANVSLDFESKRSYSVRVNVDDAAVGSTPDAVADFTLTITNVNDAALNNLVVQNGQSQRSFVRYVDLVFSHGGAELLDLISNNRIQLRRTDLSGNASNFAIPAMVVSGNRIQIDFGAQGVGGNRNSNAADGLYQFWIDTDGDGSADAFASFHRLLGDVNGDSVVDAEDRKKALSFFGQPYSAEADVNGDGLVNSADMSLLTRALGRRINSVV